MTTAEAGGRTLLNVTTIRIGFLSQLILKQVAVSLVNACVRMSFFTIWRLIVNLKFYHAMVTYHVFFHQNHKLLVETLLLVLLHSLCKSNKSRIFECVSLDICAPFTVQANQNLFFFILNFYKLPKNIYFSKKYKK